MAILQSHLTAVCQDVSGGAIINHDQEPPVESGASVMHTCQEDGQVICLTIELDIKRGNSIVVQLGCCCSCCGVIKIEDSIGMSWSKSKNWRSRSSQRDQWWRWSSLGLMDNRSHGGRTNLRNIHLRDVDLQSLFALKSQWCLRGVCSCAKEACENAMIVCIGMTNCRSSFFPN